MSDRGLTDIILCPMTENDLDEVLRIEQDSFPRPWTREHFLDEISSATSFPLVAIDTGSDPPRIAGYICPMMVLDEGHILDIAVSSSCRRRGVGRFLVERVLALARERRAAFVALEVRASNHPAILMYRELGFTETGLRKRYYENGEDAVLMEHILRDGEQHAV